MTKYADELKTSLDRNESIEAIRDKLFLTPEEVKALGFKLFFVTSRMLIDDTPNVLVHWCKYRPGGCGWPANRFTEKEAKMFTDWLRCQGDHEDIQITEMHEYTEQDAERDCAWYDQELVLRDCPFSDVFGICADQAPCR
jgi:hypothetical protein